jgi:acetyl esterase/lipase
LERIPYGPDPAQFGELTRGDGERVAVLVHGGFWRAAYDLSLMRDLAADLAARGWTTWNLEYRRLGAGGGWPATLDDVAAGIDRLADLGAFARVVAVGHSAGGHLAAWAATRGGVNEVVAQAGVLDLRLAWELRLSRGVVAELLGGTPEEVPERYSAASPRERLPLRARTLLTHGGQDEDVPVRMSAEFAEASGAELHLDPGAGHMEHLDPGSALWEAVTAWL